MASSVAEEGQSQVIRVNREEPQTPSSVETRGEERDNMRGLILPTGEINWACPCLDGMATGPCGAEFRAAFTCFHFSRADERDEECLQPLRDMQACLRTHVYAPQEEQQEVEEEGEGEEEAEMDPCVLPPGGAAAAGGGGGGDGPPPRIPHNTTPPPKSHMTQQQAPPGTTGL